MWEYLFGLVGPFLHLECSTRRKSPTTAFLNINGILTDGSRLYIIETNGARTFLAQASVTGGDTSVIPTPFTNIAVTDISRDHSQLLAVNFVGTETEAQLWTLPVAAGTPRQLSDLVGHSGVWSSDGRQLAFAKGSDIYMANADGTNARKLITVSGAAYWIRFSPDGSRLRFTRGAPGHIHHRFGKSAWMVPIFTAFSRA